jgi:hypothetical protein
MVKKNKIIEDRIKALNATIKPDEGKVNVSIEDVTKPKGTANKASFLSELKGKKKEVSKYRSIKISADQYEDIKRIARSEGIDSYGKLMKAIFKDFINRYDSDNLN